VTYPKVMTEGATLAAAGSTKNPFSIARFGDGELKLALGRDAKSQAHDPALERELRAILKAPEGPCLVCIPNILTGTPKAEFWDPFLRSPYADLYTSNPNVTYGSAFITRPDSAPWIDNEPYWERVTDLWRHRDVILVRGSSKSLTRSDLREAASVEEIIGPRQHAWSAYGELFKQLRGRKRRVLLCLGATATVLAYRLAREGVQALDLGHIGMFMRREGRFDRESFPV
jgi:hypothetical protein